MTYNLKIELPMGKLCSGCRFCAVSEMRMPPRCVFWDKKLMEDYTDSIDSFPYYIKCLKCYELELKERFDLQSKLK